MSEVRNLNVTLNPDLKIVFKKKLIDDKLKAMPFIRYFVNLLITDQIDKSTIDEILAYQADNPGTTKELTDYIKTTLTNEEHTGLFSRKLTLNILPQHYLRFFIEKYCRGELSEKDIAGIRAIIIKPGFEAGTRK